MQQQQKQQQLKQQQQQQQQQQQHKPENTDTFCHLKFATGRSSLGPFGRMTRGSMAFGDLFCFFLSAFGLSQQGSFQRQFALFSLFCHQASARCRVAAAFGAFLPEPLFTDL